MKHEDYEGPVLRSSIHALFGWQIVKTAFRRGNKVTELILTAEECFQICESGDAVCRISNALLSMESIGYNLPVAFRPFLGGQAGSAIHRPNRPQSPTGGLAVTLIGKHGLRRN